jgi:hypothetical protein
MHICIMQLLPSNQCNHELLRVCMAAVLGPLVDAVTAEIVDGVYPGRAAALLGKTVNQQVRQSALNITCYEQL